MRNRWSVIVISILFIWISFFPAPLHHKYNIAVNAALFLGVLIFLIIKRDELFKFKDYPLWFFLGAIGINVLFAQHKQAALSTYLNLAIPMFCIYYLTAGLNSKINFKFLLRVIALSSLIVAMVGILEHLMKVNIIYEGFVVNPYYRRHIGEFGRIMSTLLNPSVLGSYLLACLPFNFLMCRQDEPAWRAIGYISLIVCFTAMILTFSRGAFFAFVAMAAFYLIVRKKYRILAAVVIVFCIAIAVCGRLGYPYNRLGYGVLKKQQTSIMSDYRIGRINMALRMVKDHPLTGIGFGHYRFRFTEYAGKKDRTNYEHMIADNMHFTLLAEAGLIGYAGFLIFMLALFKRALTKQGFQAAAILAGLAGLLFNMLAYELFCWPNIYLYFCLIAGLLRWMPRQNYSKA